MPAKPPAPNPPPPREDPEDGRASLWKSFIALAVVLGGMLAFIVSSEREQRAIELRDSIKADTERLRHEAAQREKNAAIAECERNGYTAVLGYGWTVVCVRAACVPNEGSPCL
jgi:hypothetical protein